MFETVPTGRLAVVLRYLEWQATQARDELERRRHQPQEPDGWVYDRGRGSGPAGVQLHRAICVQAVPSESAEDVDDQRAGEVIREGEARPCECWAEGWTPPRSR